MVIARLLLVWFLLISALFSISPISNAHSREQLDLTNPAQSNELLRPGDLFFQSIPCWVCRLIELQEDSPFSHVGIYSGDRTNEVMQAFFQGVESIPFPDFLAQASRRDQISHQTFVYRSCELEVRGSNDPQLWDVLERHMIWHFRTRYEGLSYDPLFRWGESPNDPLYCSEFVAKFINPYLSTQIETRPMNFREYWDHWFRYFKGDVPQGLPGVSPAGIIRSGFFYPVGMIESVGTQNRWVPSQKGRSVCGVTRD